MKTKNLYTSVASNRTSSAVDWNIRRKTIAFGTCNSVAIAREIGATWQVVRTLVGHRDHVNAVKFVEEEDDASWELLSASDDGTVNVWMFRNEDDVPLPVPLNGGRKCGICTVDGIRVSEKLTIAAGLKDSFVEIWEKNQDDVMLKETLDLGRGFCLVVRLAKFLDTGSVMLLVGTSENKINLYVDSGKNFELKKTLVGHVDWIRGIDVASCPESQDMIVATSAQDNYVRLWRLSRFQKIESTGIEGESNHLEKLKFQYSGETFQIELESVLKGHEGWVYSVQLGRKADGNLQLLSASIDKSVVIWTQSADDLWLEDVRLGDIGGNQMGFLTALFGRDCDSVLTHNFQGGLQIWQKIPGQENWDVACTFGGHFGSVRDISWEPLGEYLLSVSADQTTRIHGQWEHHGERTWHEIARPQIHGYDLQAIAPLSRFKFLSAAEEKIIRCFQAPTVFGKNFMAVCKPPPETELENLLNSNVESVAISALGLSAQAQNTEGVINVEEVLKGPPTEEYLRQNSLWVEFQKLYGHGYDVYALAVSPDGKILASSCRASNAEHAKVILWDTSTWHPIQNLHAHQLTVTQIRFSPDNSRILIVSRDRRFSVFEKLPEESGKFTCTAISDKTNGIHTRIIWCCGWSHDSSIFATGSRDGKLVAWKKSNTENGSLAFYSPQAVHTFDDSITALDFAGNFIQNRFFAAIGFESGKISLCSLGDSWEILHTIENSDAHSSTVKNMSNDIPSFIPYTCFPSKMKTKNLYTSVASNRTSSAVDWNIRRKTIAFGTCNSVAIAREIGATWQVVRTLVGHRDHVNAVKFVEEEDDASWELLSASDDGTVNVWMFRNEDDVPLPVPLNGGRKCGICTVDGIRVSEKLTIAAGLKDSFVEIWEKNQDDVMLKETLDLGRGFCLVVRLAKFLDTGSVMLLVGTSENKINLYVDSGKNFELKKTLMGHVDWIRGIDVASCPESQDMIVATSAQDNYVRLWRLSRFQKIESTGIEGESNHLEKLKFQYSGETFQIELESVLKGHEGWVYSVQLGRKADGNLQLLSASIDKSVVIWTQSADDLWLEDVRLGDIGGNQMGFLTALFGRNCDSVLTHNFQGGLQIWQKIPGQENWDVACTFVLSAAEEKIIRCFQAPTVFGKNFMAVCKPSPETELENLLNSNVESVAISALGLSAQAQNTEGVINVEEVLKGPPTEEYLRQNSLWVEFQKLYGHGYDVYALAVSPDGKILASSCRASNAEHAKVILWDTSTWHPIQNLHAHQLTVTQIRFSPDNSRILIVSRDRRFSVFEKLPEESGKFTCTAISDKTNGIHTRIIWCCGWSHDSSIFATGSRDGKLVAWKKSNTENGSLAFYSPQAIHTFDDSITALDFAGNFIQNRFFAAIGFESGKISLCSLGDSWEILHTIENSDAHSSTVKSLRFRPGKHLHLASCGDDHLIRIFDLQTFTESF
uniref:Elongator complex protein 2 n=1 Tax=Lutzomyia longipalpis TaxID=7200 RepID=A0A1B0GGU9_LUTLO